MAAQAMNETNASTRADEWLTVSQAAAALEVSERTVRRRCENGKLAARLATADSGTVWEVSAAAVKAADTAVIAADTLRPRSESESDEAAAIPTDTADSAPQAAAIAADSDFLAHLQSENVFLRAQVEAANRQAAEATAALREYLKISAKALPSAEYSQAKNGLEPSKTGAAGIVSGAQKNAPERKPAREFARTLRRLLGIR